MQKLRATLRKRSSVQWISSPYLGRRKQSEKVVVTSYSAKKCGKEDAEVRSDVNQDETNAKVDELERERSLSFDKNLVQEPTFSESESPFSSEADSDTNFEVSQTNYRSKSFDHNATPKVTPKVSRGRSTGAFLDVPKWKLLIRKPSMITSSSPNNDKECTHCQLLLEFRKRPESLTSSSIGSDLDNDEFENFKFTIYDDDDDDDNDNDDNHDDNHEDNDDNNDDNDDDDVEDDNEEDEVEDDEYDSNSEADKDSNYSNEDKESSSRKCFCDPIPTINEPSDSDTDCRSGITMISLEVPVNATKQTRSSSVDSSFLKVPQRTDVEVSDQARSKSQRSRSVDIALPEGPNGPYLVVPTSYKKITTTK